MSTEIDMTPQGYDWQFVDSVWTDEISVEWIQQVKQEYGEDCRLFLRSDSYIDTGCGRDSFSYSSKSSVSIVVKKWLPVYSSEQKKVLRDKETQKFWDDLKASLKYQKKT